MLEYTEPTNNARRRQLPQVRRKRIRRHKYCEASGFALRLNREIETERVRMIAEVAKHNVDCDPGHEILPDKLAAFQASSVRMVRQRHGLGFTPAKQRDGGVGYYHARPRNQRFTAVLLRTLSAGRKLALDRAERVDAAIGRLGPEAFGSVPKDGA